MKFLCRTWSLYRAAPGTAGLILAIAFFASTSLAQTTVCNGDSVVLVLKGYSQGNTLWQQSSNRTQWSPTSGTAYNDSLVLTATNTYYYRAKVNDGTCIPFYSDTVQVIVNPASPIAKPATSVTQYGFTANWASVSSPGDTAYYTYYLDVSTVPTYASFVTGFNNIEVGSNTDSIYSISPVGCNTIYYYRVRAYNGHCGASANSNTITVTTDTCPLPVYCTYKSTCSGNIIDTRDSKIYTTVQIGTQCWMAQNLNVGNRIDGNKPQTLGADNQDTSIEKYCYGDVPAKCDTFGGLYLWNEMMAYDTSRINPPGPRGICPAGWHIPTDNEWKCLEMTLGMSQTEADKGNAYRGTTDEGNKLKTKGNGGSPLWASPSAGTNTSGFSAFPSGGRNYNGTFGGQGSGAYFWTATELDVAHVWFHVLAFNLAKVDRASYYKPLGGYSVRCVKDF